MLPIKKTLKANNNFRTCLRCILPKHWENVKALSILYHYTLAKLGLHNHLFRFKLNSAMGRYRPCGH